MTSARGVVSRAFEWRAVAANLVIGVVLAAVIVDRVPLTANSLLDTAIALHTEQPGAQMLHVFSGVQGRPTETCSTFEARHASVIEDIRAEAATASAGGTWSGPISALRIFDRRMRQLFLTRPDESCWKEFADYAYFQGGFPTDAPYIWTFARLGLSTAHIALALVVGAWAGLVCLFLIARRLSGSSIAGLATVILNAAVWQWWQFPVGNYIFVLNCFVPMFVAMRLATPPEDGGVTGIRLVALEVALITCFVPNAFLQGCFYPFTHRVNGTVAVIAILAVGLVRLNRRVLARGVAVVILVMLFNAPYFRDVNGLYGQLTTQNLATNEGFAEGQMAMSLFERPTYLGLPNGDYAFTWMHAIDPFLYYTAPHLIVHQAFRHFGKTMMVDVLRSHPLTIPSAIFRRAFLQIAYHHQLYFWWYRPADTSALIRYWTLAAAFGAFAVACAWSIRKSHRCSLLWPVAAFIGWHAFGVNIILTIVHTHEKYVFSGALVLLTLAPAIATFLIRDTLGERRVHRPAPAVLMWLQSRWPFRARHTAAAGLLAAIVLTPVLVAEARKEIDVFWLWFPVHAVTSPSPLFDRELWRSPDALRRRVDHLESLGESEPGANEMYAAWIFWVYNNQNPVNRRGPARDDPAAQERFKAEAQAYMERAYRAALSAAPDNPNFASYALMINAPDWPEIFRRAINQWPEYHHTPYMAYHMIFQAKTNSPEERTRFIQIYEDGMGRTLASSAADRPGYQWRPNVTLASANGGPAERKHVDARGEFALQTSDSLLLDPIAVRRAPKLRLGLYVYVPEGQVQTMAVDAAGAVIASCSQFTSSYLDALHYRYVECAAVDRIESLRLRLTALQPTRLVIRDYYPMFSIVRTAAP